MTGYRPVDYFKSIIIEEPEDTPILTLLTANVDYFNVTRGVLNGRNQGISVWEFIVSPGGPFIMDGPTEKKIRFGYDT